MNIAEMQGLLDELECGSLTFNLYEDHKLYLQVKAPAACSNTGVVKAQRGRKWYLSPWMTKSELVQTALKAALTYVEHETREHFKYRGRAVFGPHYDVDALWEVCDQTDEWAETAKKRARHYIDEARKALDESMKKQGRWLIGRDLPQGEG